jgi:hydrogenase expression/formation protein HypD
MKYVDEFHDSKLCQSLSEQIRRSAGDREMTFMEVCGTHTVAIFRSGIKDILPDSIKLLSGPGCPVCVTPNSQIDRMIAYARREDVIITTFGDMMKVPGSTSSLSKEKSSGKDIRVVYSVGDALKIAQDNQNKKVIFFGIGFETTAPTIALSVIDAKEKGIANYLVLSVHKVVPPAMKALLDIGEINLNGFLLPGHVSTITGTKAYEFIPRDYGIPCAVAGFEPVDILRAILALIEQGNTDTEQAPTIDNCYKRSVREDGNPSALAVLDQVFEIVESEWRGVGTIPGSGLRIREEYGSVDAERNIKVDVKPTEENPDCICGDILRGVKKPPDCTLFGKKCTPENPVGACMVSSVFLRDSMVFPACRQAGVVSYSLSFTIRLVLCSSVSFCG